MTSSKLNVPVNKLVGDLTMEVSITGMRSYRVRQWIAIKLMTLAAAIMGCGIEVDIRK